MCSLQVLLLSIWVKKYRPGVLASSFVWFAPFILRPWLWRTLFFIAYYILPFGKLPKFSRLPSICNMFDAFSFSSPRSCLTSQTKKPSLRCTLVRSTWLRPSSTSWHGVPSARVSACAGPCCPASSPLWALDLCLRIHESALCRFVRPLSAGWRRFGILTADKLQSALVMFPSSRSFADDRPDRSRAWLTDLLAKYYQIEVRKKFLLHTHSTHSSQALTRQRRLKGCFSNSGI